MTASFVQVNLFRNSELIAQIVRVFIRFFCLHTSGHALACNRIAKPPPPSRRTEPVVFDLIAPLLHRRRRQRLAGGPAAA